MLCSSPGTLELLCLLTAGGPGFLRGWHHVALLSEHLIQRLRQETALRLFHPVDKHLLALGTAGLIQNPYPTLNLLNPRWGGDTTRRALMRFNPCTWYVPSIPQSSSKDAAELPGNILHIGILQIEEPDATVLKGVDIHQL